MTAYELALLTLRHYSGAGHASTSTAKWAVSYALNYLAERPDDTTIEEAVRIVEDALLKLSLGGDNGG